MSSPFTFGGGSKPAAGSGGGFTFGASTNNPPAAAGAPTASPFTFGSAPQAKPASGAPTGFTFGASATGAPPTATTAPAPVTSGFVFGSSANNATGGSGFSFGATPAAQTGVQAGAGIPAASSSAKPFTFGASSTTTAPTSGGLFGSSTPAAAMGSVNATQAPAPAGGFSFGAPSTTAPSTTPGALFGAAAPAPAPAPANKFTFGTPVATTTAATAAAPAPSTGSFTFGAPAPQNASANEPAKVSNAFSFGAPASKPVSTAPVAASTQPPTSTAPASVPPSTGFFSALGGKTTTDSKPVHSSVTTSSNAATVAPAGDGKASDAKPLVKNEAGWTLRNKTMEEISNKWSQDLDLYTKEFHGLANEVQSWDRLLIDNGGKLAKLIHSVEDIENNQKVIEDSLEYVEKQQSVLTDFLDKFEDSVKDILKQGQGYRRMTKADTEREKAFILAERLDDELNNTSKSLADLAVEVDDAKLKIESSLNITEEDAPLFEVIEIIKNHNEAVTRIEKESDDLSKKIASLFIQSRDLSASLT